MTNDHTIKRTAALYLLSHGLASLSEVADAAGVSRQLVRYWVTRAGLDWQAIRRGRLRREWRKLTTPPSTAT